MLSSSLGGKAAKKPWTNPGSALCTGICAREEAAAFIPARFFPSGRSSASSDLFHLLGSRSAARITREESGPGSSSCLPMPSCGATPCTGMGQGQGLVPVEGLGPDWEAGQPMWVFPFCPVPITWSVWLRIWCGQSPGAEGCCVPRWAWGCRQGSACPTPAPAGTAPARSTSRIPGEPSSPLRFQHPADPAPSCVLLYPAKLQHSQSHLGCSVSPSTRAWFPRSPLRTSVHCHQPRSDGAGREDQGGCRNQLRSLLQGGGRG